MERLQRGTPGGAEGSDIRRGSILIVIFARIAIEKLRLPIASRAKTFGMHRNPIM
ncbi:MAG: hypothetical protein KGJ79_16575 [Alphaproteobacteria bacterium]|nr:hypothetical protein [Alphaproteobacteria bacterium]MDE2495708.1 hypothetical protein [Alphaproteobacteria bacterium]